MLRRRQRASDRPAYHPPMNAELRGDARDRADPKLMLTTELLEQFQFGFPVHKRPPDPIGLTVGSRTGGGPKLASTPGLKFDSIARIESEPLLEADRGCRRHAESHTTSRFRRKQGTRARNEVRTGEEVRRSAPEGTMQ
jgi:hypothetical protein